jgi:hypothetical protein
MKKVFLILMIISVNANSQESSVEIITLTLKKKEFLKKIENLNDSIKSLDFKISTITSEKVMNKDSEAPLIGRAKKDARLKSTPSLFGEEILKLNEGTQIVVLDVEQDDYLKVRVGSINGFISDMWLKWDEGINNFIAFRKKEIEKLAKTELHRKNNEETKKDELAAKKNEKLAIAKYGVTTYKKLKDGYYWIGMTKDMATIALGEANDINRTVGSWGVHEQWMYTNNFYLYFENGKLTSYQN